MSDFGLFNSTSSDEALAAAGVSGNTGGKGSGLFDNVADVSRDEGTGGNATVGGGPTPGVTISYNDFITRLMRPESQVSTSSPPMM